MTYQPSEKRRWEKFNFAEWLNDPALLQCSRAARSLWLDMCGLIYAAEDGGRLTIDGKSPSHNELAARLHDHGSRVKTLIFELEKHKVFDRDHEGKIVSRRISRELLAREKGKQNGRLGGNPSLVSKDKPQEGVNLRSQKPEARIEEGLQALVDKGLRSLGPGAVDHRHDTAPRRSLETLLPEWLAKWDFELDILPVLKAQTKAPRKRPLRFFTRLAEDVATHHEKRVSGLPFDRAQNLQELPHGASALAYPDGMAGEALRAVVAAKGQSWAKAWMGAVEWNGTDVYARSEIERTRIDQEVGHILRDHGYLSVVVRRP